MLDTDPPGGLLLARHLIDGEPLGRRLLTRRAWISSGNALARPLWPLSTHGRDGGVLAQQVLDALGLDGGLVAHAARAHYPRPVPAPTEDQTVRMHARIKTILAWSLWLTTSAAAPVALRSPWPAPATHLAAWPRSPLTPSPSRSPCDRRADPDTAAARQPDRLAVCDRRPGLVVGYPLTTVGRSPDPQRPPSALGRPADHRAHGAWQGASDRARRHAARLLLPGGCVHAAGRWRWPPALPGSPWRWWGSAWRRYDWKSRRSTIDSGWPACWHGGHGGRDHRRGVGLGQPARGGGLRGAALPAGRGIEREQLRWVPAGAAAAVAGLILAIPGVGQLDRQFGEALPGQLCNDRIGEGRMGHDGVDTRA